MNSEYTNREESLIDSENLEKKIYNRVLDSYDQHLRQIKRKRYYKIAAFWIGICCISIVTTLVIQKQTSTTEKELVFLTEKTSRVIQLADSSIVTLEPNSSLTVAGDFNKKKREVHLVGTAIFDVKSNKKKAFTVHSEHLKTNVLGTKFYQKNTSDNIVVFLEEGSIHVEIKDRGDYILKPNDELTYNPESKQVKRTNTQDIEFDLSKGNFKLNGVDIQTLQNCLTHYFDIRLIDKGEKAKEISFKINLSANMSVEEIGSILETITAQKISINERTITIK